MSQKIKLAVLFSGNGSNFEAIVKNLHKRHFVCENRAFMQGFSQCLICGISNEVCVVQEPQENSLEIEISLAICNKRGAYGINRAKNLGINCIVLEQENFASRDEFDTELVGILERQNINLAILAGFMRILGKKFTSAIPALNIHPSILPLFKGAHGIKESFESPMKVGGASVHWVSDELDSGALIAQGVLEKIDGESLSSYEARVHKLEHYLYPLSILQVLFNAQKSAFEEINEEIK